MSSKNINAQVKYTGPLIAPLEKDQEVATLEITIPGMETISKPLYAAEAVPELGLFAKTIEKAKMFIAGK